MTQLTGSKERFKCSGFSRDSLKNSSLILMKAIFLDQLNREQLNFSLSSNMLLQGGSNMNGTDLCVHKRKQSRSYLKHLVK